MDIGKPKRVRVALRTEGEAMHEVTTEEGAPLVPVIGGKPDKKTQNIPLLDLIAKINFRGKGKTKPPEEPTE
ncbi:MAG: hypothetical protein ACOY3M_02510 [Patescibacteria group bacterium]